MAVLCAYNVAPTQGAQQQAMKQQATAYCDRARRGPRAWAHCLDLLLHTSHVSVHFATLGFLQDIIAEEGWERMAPADRDRVRTGVLGWVRGRFPQLDATPLYVRNKMAVVVARLLKAEYPDRWPSAFQELEAWLAASPAAVHLWLRVLFYVDEEVVRFDVTAGKRANARSTRIKDTMRLGAVPRLYERLREIVEAGLGPAAGGAPAAPPPAAPGRAAAQNAAEALVALAALVVWADVRLTTDPRILSLLCRCLARPGLRTRAAECLQRLVAKGMPSADKLRLLRELGILGVIRNVPGLVRMLEGHAAVDPHGGAAAADRALVAQESPHDEELSGFLRALARLTNLIGTVLFAAVVAMKRPDAASTARGGGLARDAACVAAGAQIRLARPNHATASTALLPDARALLREAVDLVWPFFAARDWRIAEEVCDVVQCVPQGSMADAVRLQGRRRAQPGGKGARPAGLGRFSGNGAEEPWLAEHDGRITAILLRQMRFPPGTRVGGDDDGESDFFSFRKRLVEIFHCCVRARPDAILGQIKAQLGPQAPLPLARLGALPFEGVEALLTLVYQFAVDNVPATKTPQFVELIEALHGSTVGEHPHHAVCLVYMELTQRYWKVLRQRPEIVPRVLAMMLGSGGRGLHSPHPTVRGRTCYMLMKIVQLLDKAMQPYCNQLMQGVQAVIRIPHGPEPTTPAPDGALRFEDQLHLFELSGSLLAAQWIPPEPQIQCMQVRFPFRRPAKARLVCCLPRSSFWLLPVFCLPEFDVDFGRARVSSCFVRGGPRPAFHTHTHPLGQTARDDLKLFRIASLNDARRGNSETRLEERYV